VLDDMRRYRNFWLPYLQAINDSRPITGLGISLIEAIVIGEDTNTGPAQWRALTGEAPIAAAAPAPAAAPAAPKPVRRAERGSGFGGLEAMALGTMAQPTRGGGGGPTGPVRGFPGVNPHLMIEPNGLAIVGYASSIDAAVEFATNLKNTGMFVDVWLDEQYFDVVPEEDLARARTTSPVGGRSTTERSAGRGSGSQTTGFEQLANIGAPSISRAPTSAGPGGGTGVELYLFHIDVQIMGKPNPHPPSRLAAASAPKP
jgi:hypothetical protein